MSRKNHVGCERGFTIQSESWYVSTAQEPGLTDEIMMGMYAPEGGTSGEFAVRWVLIGKDPVPCLEAFNDSWSALSLFADVLAWMASRDGERISPQNFAEALRVLGVKDLTQRVNPRTSPGEREWASWFPG